MLRRYDIGVLHLQANVKDKILEYKEMLRDARMYDAKTDRCKDTERCSDERCKDRTNDKLDVSTWDLDVMLWLLPRKDVAFSFILRENE